MTTLTFTIPADTWLTHNGRLHWAVKAKRTKTLRALGHLKAREANLRDLGPTLVTAHIGYLTNGRVDPANCAVLKPLIDGMTDAGVWPDDDSTHVVGPMPLRGPKSPTPGAYTVTLTLTPA